MSKADGEADRAAERRLEQVVVSFVDEAVAGDVDQARRLLLDASALGVEGLRLPAQVWVEQERVASRDGGWS